MDSVLCGEAKDLKSASKWGMFSMWKLGVEFDFVINFTQLLQFRVKVSVKLASSVMKFVSMAQVWAADPLAVIISWLERVSRRARSRRPRRRVGSSILLCSSSLAFVVCVGFRLAHSLRERHFHFSSAAAWVVCLRGCVAGPKTSETGNSANTVRIWLFMCGRQWVSSSPIVRWDRCVFGSSRWSLLSKTWLILSKNQQLLFSLACGVRGACCRARGCCRRACAAGRRGCPGRCSSSASWCRGRSPGGRAASP